MRRVDGNIDAAAAIPPSGAEILHDLGCTTGEFGKNHLGYRQGFRAALTHVKSWYSASRKM